MMYKNIKLSDLDCGCRSRDGKVKKAYYSEKDAQKMAEIRMKKDKYLNLDIYRCDEGNWHLTNNTSIFYIVKTLLFG